MHILNSLKLQSALRIAIGTLLCISAMVKILDFDIFWQIEFTYNLFPSSWRAVLADLLPYIELITGMMLVVNLFIRTASVAAIIFLTVFAFAESFLQFLVHLAIILIIFSLWILLSPRLFGHFSPGLFYRFC